jgi:hypothetical protein
MKIAYSDKFLPLNELDIGDFFILPDSGKLCMKIPSSSFDEQRFIDLINRGLATREPDFMVYALYNVTITLNQE